MSTKIEQEHTLEGKNETPKQELDSSEIKQTLSDDTRMILRASGRDPEMVMQMIAYKKRDALINHLKSDSSGNGNPAIGQLGGTPKIPTEGLLGYTLETLIREHSIKNVDENNKEEKSEKLESTNLTLNLSDDTQRILSLGGTDSKMIIEMIEGKKRNSLIWYLQLHLNSGGDKITSLRSFKTLKESIRNRALHELKIDLDAAVAVARLNKAKKLATQRNHDGKKVTIPKQIKSDVLILKIAKENPIKEFLIGRKGLFKTTGEIARYIIKEEETLKGMIPVQFHQHIFKTERNIKASFDAMFGPNKTSRAHTILLIDAICKLKGMNIGGIESKEYQVDIITNMCVLNKDPTWTPGEVPKETPKKIESKNTSRLEVDPMLEQEDEEFKIAKKFDFKKFFIGKNGIFETMNEMASFIKDNKKLHEACSKGNPKILKILDKSEKKIYGSLSAIMNKRQTSDPCWLLIFTKICEIKKMILWSEKASNMAIITYMSLLHKDPKYLPPVFVPKIYSAASKKGQIVMQSDSEETLLVKEINEDGGKEKEKIDEEKQEITKFESALTRLLNSKGVINGFAKPIVEANLMNENYPTVVEMLKTIKTGGVVDETQKKTLLAAAKIAGYNEGEIAGFIDEHNLIIPDKE